MRRTETEIVTKGHGELIALRSRIAIPRTPAARPVRAWLRALFTLPVTDHYLSAGERCVIRTRRHWLVPLRDLTRGGGMMGIVGVLTFLAPQVFLVQLALWLGALMHTGCIGYCVLNWRLEQIAATDRRIIRVSGLLTLRVDTVPLSKITDISYRQSVIGHVFNYGSLRIETSGQTQALEHINFLPSPAAIYRALLR